MLKLQTIALLFSIFCLLQAKVYLFIDLDETLVHGDRKGYADQSFKSVVTENLNYMTVEWEDKGPVKVPYFARSYLTDFVKSLNALNKLDSVEVIIWTNSHVDIATNAFQELKKKNELLWGNFLSIVWFLSGFEICFSDTSY